MSGDVFLPVGAFFGLRRTSGMFFGFKSVWDDPGGLSWWIVGASCCHLVGGLAVQNLVDGPVAVSLD